MPVSPKLDPAVQQNRMLIKNQRRQIGDLKSKVHYRLKKGKKRCTFVSVHFRYIFRIPIKELLFPLLRLYQFVCSQLSHKNRKMKYLIEILLFLVVGVWKKNS